MNTYECRIQNGISQGQCALGFGVCCICKRFHLKYIDVGTFHIGKNYTGQNKCAVNHLIKNDREFVYLQMGDK